eukprot:Pgem_evm1s9539
MTKENLLCYKKNENTWENGLPDSSVVKSKLLERVGRGFDSRSVIHFSTHVKMRNEIIYNRICYKKKREYVGNFPTHVKMRNEIIYYVISTMTLPTLSPTLP